MLFVKYINKRLNMKQNTIKVSVIKVDNDFIHKKFDHVIKSLKSRRYAMGPSVLVIKSCISLSLSLLNLYHGIWSHNKLYNAMCPSV